jgi:hypothetical protein
MAIGHYHSARQILIEPCPAAVSARSREDTRYASLPVGPFYACAVQRVRQLQQQQSTAALAYYRCRAARFDGCLPEWQPAAMLITD